MAEKQSRADQDNLRVQRSFGLTVLNLFFFLMCAIDASAHSAAHILACGKVARSFAGALFNAFQQCSKACAHLQERDEMVRYVTEEVDRLKELFQERESRLTSERDKANEGYQEASRKCKELGSSLEEAESRALSLSSDLKVNKCCAFFLIWHLNQQIHTKCDDIVCQEISSCF